MREDIIHGDRSGVSVRAYQDGLYLSGWYDTYVYIEGGFITWAEIEELRKKARRRRPWA